MNSHPNNTNPYAPPVPVEKDAPGYDLRKIAGFYNRLGYWVERFAELCVVELIIIILLGLTLPAINSSHPPTNMILLLIGLIIPLHFIIGLLFIYCAYLVEHIARAMKYSFYVTILIASCALIFPANFLVINRMRRKAAQILRDAGIEITGGKVDLAKIPVENDY